jgi:microcin C transport system substrate-binding protein
MKRLILLLPILISACGGSEPAGDQQAEDRVDGADAVVFGNTRLVENPPVYESEPLPEGLEWVTNEEDAVFASPDAQRGGSFNDFMISFPLTLRIVGPDSNGAFANYLRPNNQIPLVTLHPNTLTYIPYLATHWAFHPDGKTAFYRINPNATWSDGEPITADDFMFTWDFARSEYTLAPFYQDYFGSEIVKITKHDDYTISIEGATAKPRDELLSEYGLWPTPRHFHRLDENWVVDYNWRIEPNAGPYQISRVENGRFIEFSRTQDWWGDELRYMRNRFNPDTVRYTVIRDVNVAWEYFLRGELDSFPIVLPNYFHDKAVGEPFDKGWIKRIKFYTDSPQPSQGMWLNMDEPILADLNVRLGLHHAMNVDLMLSGLLRGDYERLRMHYDGYWDYSHPDIQPREFDLDRAGEYFDAAGWSDFGPDGIRVRDGARLALTVLYSTQEHTARLVVLREEAKKAGVELNLQLTDSSSAFRQILEKQHQIGWMAYSTSARPSPWQHYHSDNAHIPQTNNITNTDDPELDALIDAYDAATEKEARVRLSHEIQQKIHDIGMFIPMYKVPYTREAYWRWLELPAHHATRTTGAIFDAMQEGLFWIDEAAKEETLAGRQQGVAFESVYTEDTVWRTP